LLEFTASGPLTNLSRPPTALRLRDRYNSVFFLKPKKGLTTLPILGYRSGHKKHRLKILSIEILRTRKIRRDLH
jgi:hypothetical protein